MCNILTWLNHKIKSRAKWIFTRFHWWAHNPFVRWIPISVGFCGQCVQDNVGNKDECHGYVLWCNLVSHETDILFIAAVTELHYTYILFLAPVTELWIILEDSPVLGLVNFFVNLWTKFWQWALHLYATMCAVTLIHWNSNQSITIFKKENGFQNVICKMEAILSKPKCVMLTVIGLNVWSPLCVTFCNIDWDDCLQEIFILFMMSLCSCKTQLP